MNSEWTIGKKLTVGFMSVALVVLLLGLVGYYSAHSGAKSVEEIGAVRLPSVDSLLVIEREAQSIRATMRTLSVPGLPKEVRAQQYEALADSRTTYRTAWDIYEPLPQTEQEAVLWKQFVPAWDAWAIENNRMMELAKEVDALAISNPYQLNANIERFTKDHYALAEKIMHLLSAKEEFSGGDDHTACALGTWMSSFQSDNPAIQSIVQEIRDPHKRFHEAVAEIKKNSAEGKQEEAQQHYDQDMEPAMEDVFGHLHEITEISSHAVETFQEMITHDAERVMPAQQKGLALLNELVEINREIAHEEVDKAEHQAAFLEVLSLTATVIGIIVAIVLGALITRGINRSLRYLAESLGSGAEQVTAAAGQVASASQSLAEGATEQAAGLEETSSSLEEMTSMTKQSAANAQEANVLAGEARNAAESGSAAMNQMSSAINDIQTSSTETAKIIKVIDEIAFQTNLLALNAAVEAARAGEAGKGFAVVAEEVRNLAKRSAEAAKDTSSLIEGAVKNAQNGVEITAKVGLSLDEIVGNVTKTSELVSEIAAAADEQAQGIGQVNSAVTQMDSVTQANAANAEESASASEELSSQAEQMNEMVIKLVSMVGGGGAPPAVRKREAPSAPANSSRQAAQKAIPFDDDLDGFNS